MTINCPHGQRWISHFKKAGFIFENRTVQIFNGVCDHCDKCGVTDCEYFDDTPEGTRKFCQGLAHSHTAEGMLEEKQLKESGRG
tara:strand:+ start:733 stop:984 length:252 start_codon:yes stop_codon:yes gene_type:complete